MVTGTKFMYVRLQTPEVALPFPQEAGSVQSGRMMGSNSTTGKETG